MKYFRGILISGAFALSACAPENQADDIEPLAGNSEIEERILSAGLASSLASAAGFEGFGAVDGDRSFHSDIALYETVLSYGPVDDPRPVFLLANAYITSSQQIIGIAYFERLLKRYENQMSDDVRSTYLSAYAVLRATYAAEVPMIRGSSSDHWKRADIAQSMECGIWRR